MKRTEGKTKARTLFHPVIHSAIVWNNTIKNVRARKAVLKIRREEEKNIESISLPPVLSSRP